MSRRLREEAVSLTSGLDGGGWSSQRLNRVTPGKRTGAHCTRGGMFSRAGGRVRKISPTPVFDPPGRPARSESYCMSHLSHISYREYKL